MRRADTKFVVAFNKSLAKMDYYPDEKELNNAKRVVQVVPVMPKPKHEMKFRVVEAVHVLKPILCSGNPPTFPTISYFCTDQKRKAVNVYGSAC